MPASLSPIPLALWGLLGQSASDGWICLTSELERQHQEAREAIATCERSHEQCDFAAVEQGYMPYILLESSRRDLAGARRLANLGCSAGDPDACEQLALLWGPGWGSPDLHQAVAALLRGCDAGRRSLCQEAALSLIFYSSDPRDQQTGQRMLRGMATTGDRVALLSLAALTWGGIEGAPAELREALRSCQEHPDAAPGDCARIASALTAEPTP